MYRKYQNFFLKNNIIGFPKINTNLNTKDALSTFNILVKKRSKLIKLFNKKKIPFKIYYPKPLYNQYNLKIKVKLKNTEFLCKSIISLPFNDINKTRFKSTLNKLNKIISINKEIFFEKKI